MLQAREDSFDSTVRDVGFEIIRGDVFEVMRFIDDESGGPWKESALLVVGKAGAQNHVGHQQVMIDDQEICRSRCAPGFIKEAGIVFRTAAAETIVVLGDHLLPGFESRHETEVGEAAILGVLAPFEYGRELSA
jgi:hypothetical protein